MELEESTYLISGSATKPQLSRQYGTGTKTEIQILRTMKFFSMLGNPQIKPTASQIFGFAMMSFGA